MNEDHTYTDVLDSIKIQAGVDENYTMLPGEVKILWQGLQDAQKDYQGMREFQEKFMKADHELREAQDALADCVQVLKYIGGGVSAHGMAKDFANKHDHLLTQVQRDGASSRIISYESDNFKRLQQEFK